MSPKVARPRTLKQRRKKERADRVDVRERNWIAGYERNQAAVLGLSAYQLPRSERRSRK